MNSQLLNIQGNIEKAIRLVGNKHADLMVLPELFNTGYNFRNRREVFGVAERIPDGRTTRSLEDFSRRDGATIVAGIAERSDGNLYNSAVIVHDGEYLGTYRKVHLFHNEKKFFTPGRQFRVFGRIGVMICFDWYFPESARTLMLKGAEVIAHPSNLVMPHCPEAMKVRAVENKVFAVTADRVGVERGLRFIGRSEIVTPDGELLYRASPTSEECVVREIDLSRAHNKNVTPNNNLLRDRTPRAYS
jgi:predicted amidohydrolase